MLATLIASSYKFSPAHAQINRAQGIQSEIEQSIRATIGSQLTPAEFFIYSKVKLKDEAPQSGDATQNKYVDVPYSPIRVEKVYLEELLRKSQGKQPELAELVVTLVFDERVPQTKIELLTEVIKSRYDFDDQTKRLEVKTLKLVTEPIPQQERLILEKTKLESEKALMELQSEKTKFEISRREEELKKRLEEMEKPKTVEAPPPQSPASDPPATPAVNAPAATPASTPAPAPNKPAEPATAQPPPPSVIAKMPLAERKPIDYLESFQLLLFAFLSGVFLLAATSLVGGMLKKGLQPLAEAVKKIGEGTERAAAAVAAPSAAVASTVSGTHSEASGNMGGGKSLAGGDGKLSVDNAATVSSSVQDKSVDEFIEAVSEKLKILVSEKKYSFYRHFCDLLEAEPTRIFAASIMLTLDDENISQLLEGISADQIELLKDQLARPGAVSEAQAVRKTALQEFYGRIAAEEFSGSPLAKLKDVTWLTTMNAKNMAAFVISLDVEVRSAFLACLSPMRVNAILKATTKNEDKKQIITALKQLENVSPQQITENLAKLSGNYAAFPSLKEDKKHVDLPKFLAQLLDSLPITERSLLVSEIESDQDLSKRMRDFIIPFTAIKMVPKDLVKEIFGARSDQQVAQILYAADASIRQCVLDVLPNIRKENVNAELSTLDNNKVFAKRNQNLSNEMQAQICKYLLGLYKEGIFSLDQDSSDTKPNNLELVNVA